MVRRTIFMLILSLCSSLLSAQGGLAAMSEEESRAFEQLIASRSASTGSLVADFRQEKSMEILKKKMVSTGQFLYAKSDKIAFLYQKPQQYSMIINGTRLKTVSGGKISVMELKNNPVMKQMNELISAAFLGNFSAKSGSYKISYSKGKDVVVANVLPVSKEISSIIKRITVTFGSSGGEIREITVYEANNSTTDYIFTNHKLNSAIPDEVF